MDFFFQSEESLCGVSGLGTGIFPLFACKRDMTSHLVSLGISGKRGGGKTRITVSELILNRAGRFGTVNEEEIQTIIICPKHRKELTTVCDQMAELTIRKRKQTYFCHCEDAYLELKSQNNYLLKWKFRMLPAILSHWNIS